MTTPSSSFSLYRNSHHRKLASWSWSRSHYIHYNTLGYKHMKNSTKKHKHLKYFNNKLKKKKRFIMYIMPPLIGIMSLQQHMVLSYVELKAIITRRIMRTLTWRIPDIFFHFLHTTYSILTFVQSRIFFGMLVVYWMKCRNYLFWHSSNSQFLKWGQYP